MSAAPSTQVSTQMSTQLAALLPGEVAPAKAGSPVRCRRCVAWLTALALLGGGCSAVQRWTPPPAAPSPCAEQTAIDVLHHEVELTLQLEPPALTGQGVVRVKARCPTATVVLDAKLRISAVATDTGPLRFHAGSGQLRIELPQPLPAGAEARLQIAWEARTDSATPKFSAEQVFAGYSAAAWLPTRQDPAQRATLALRIVAPAELTVVASGSALAKEPLPRGRTRHSFGLDRPTPPFLYAFAAGRFQQASVELDGLQLRALGPPGSELSTALAVTAHAYRFLFEKLQTRLPSAGYSQVFVRGEAAQEAAGLALLGDSFLADLAADPKEDWVFSHELAHQWFAWLVPCADFADFWLNEGLATFLVAAIKEQRWGQSAYERELALWRARSAKVHQAGRDQPLSLSAPGAPGRPPPSESQLQPRGVTYARGALALHRLRGELGEDSFWSGLRLYVKERAGQGARSEDLRRAMEAASGRDLRPFFARWVYAAAPDI